VSGPARRLALAKSCSHIHSWKGPDGHAKDRHGQDRARPRGHRLRTALAQRIIDGLQAEITEIRGLIGQG
jgi:hypothetical protein